MPGKDAVIFFQLNPFQPFLFPKKKRTHPDVSQLKLLSTFRRSAMLAKSSAVVLLRRNETVILLGRLCAAVSVFLEEGLFHR